MENYNIDASVTLVKNFAQNKTVLIPIIGQFNELKNDMELPATVSWLPNLLNLKVTKKSQFHEHVWDYNEDYLNPPKSVQGAKLRIDFNDYPSIPDFVMTEIKCLLHMCTVIPIAFSKKKKKTKRKERIAIRPNTVITQFRAGLRYIDKVFEDLSSLGQEFVDERFQSLTDILDSDFRETAKSFEYIAGTELRRFFYYLTHPFTKNILGSSIKIDFESLEWPAHEIKKREAKQYFENEDFEQLMLHSTFTVIDFLTRISQEIEDKTALKHFNAFNKKRDLNFDFDESTLNDYVLLRLWSKGYSQSFIASKCQIPSEFCDPSGKLYYHEEIRKVMNSKHNIRHFDHVRNYVNQVYYASSFLTAQLTGMRPEELSEIRISSCLIEHEGFDVLVSNVKKNDLENLTLFDDKWVAIPIMKDAIKAASLISPLKNNDFLFSNMDTVSPEKTASSMGSAGIKHFIDNYLNVVLGKERTKAIKFNAYMFRHSLAYQLHRIELGLPFISFQLKHVVDDVGKYTSFGSSSGTTLGYGEIAENIIANKSMNKSIRRDAEVERIKTVMDPDGVYAGPKAQEHKARLNKVFQGYMDLGYTKDEIFDAMAEQGMAVINVGTGFCFGGMEDYDKSIPCIGSLRCNPIRCKNAIVGKANIPKWKEVYASNVALLGKDGYEDRQSQLTEAIEEAKQVLIYLGEAVD
ncbi:site-specific integrase [Pseudoalteromonas sp. 10-33]|uniref:site-specific integrase n=1 Tax=Pseudoalteromonas sp. 10-33 TaxID=1761890 RepID=UPI0007321FC3|nr:site-specific integrase [Pseudoalteromonas sp. 10-33]KTF19538.1 hypothetical protein ATS76_02620 [Pseudoalteromonas sp. 10-33]